MVCNRPVEVGVAVKDCGERFDSQLLDSLTVMELLTNLKNVEKFITRGQKTSQSRVNEQIGVGKEIKKKKKCVKHIGRLLEQIKWLV